MSLRTLAAIKRVPDTGAKINLTEDEQRVDASNLGYTMSPHEECGIEEAVQQAEEHGGSSTVLTLGDADAEEQLRTGIAMQADDAALIESDEHAWDPIATAQAIATGIEHLESEGEDFDVLLFGNESADAENYQVGVRVAAHLDIPCVTGIKSLSIDDGTATAKREIARGSEVYEVDLPALFTVKEGLNEPRYPSMRAKMQARRAEIDRVPAEGTSGGPETVRLIVPEEDDSPAEILGEGPDAADDVVDILEQLEVV